MGTDPIRPVAMRCRPPRRGGNPSRNSPGFRPSVCRNHLRATPTARPRKCPPPDRLRDEVVGPTDRGQVPWRCSPEQRCPVGHRAEVAIRSGRSSGFRSFDPRRRVEPLIPNSAVGHRGLRGKTGEHRESGEFGENMVRRAVHLWGECTNSRRYVAKHLSVFSLRLSSASVTCPNCRF